MVRIEIEPQWRFRQDGDPQSMLIMLDFLNEIRATGKITRAADRAGLSYRHCWNLIEKWSSFFDAPLVTRQQGRGTQLTPLGDKLVWAGQRLQARLGPQLQNLAQELETEINQLLPHAASVVRMHASHGFAVSALRDMLAREPGITLDLRYVSNQNSLVSLAHDACEFAGMHLPQGPLRARNVAACRALLNPALHRVVGLVTREMGLMVKRGNPIGITGLERLIDPAVRLVNRDPDSGTRVLFDQLLAQHRIDPSRVTGYEQIEFTHPAVAAYVASGMADVAFGVEAAARQFDLDFVPVVTEDYFFVCQKSALEWPAVQRMLAIMQGEAFHAVIAALPGYAARDTGVVKTLAEAFRDEERVDR